MALHDEAMRREHQSWLAVGRMLKQAGIDLNGDDALTAALQLWGENLAMLRSLQPSEQAVEAMVEAEARFNREVGFVPYHVTEVM